MTESNHNEEPRKISLADAIKNKLAQKKQAQAEKGSGPLRPGSDAVMHSQNNKKPNNQRRRTGGS
ncbi:hypothetical protein [Paenibacillus sp. YYML68]|uniref:hypothetical protein n=1 Tax=Paenibacillus sp. YYML68 TaxID=2909250 RepID=UPI00248F6EB7|nr:hypothetical protein [Paenibacillus sp. YYML68]